MDHLGVYNSATLSTSTLLCNLYHCLSPKCFPSSQTETVSLNHFALMYKLLLIRSSGFFWPFLPPFWVCTFHVYWLTPHGKMGHMVLYGPQGQEPSCASERNWELRTAAPTVRNSVLLLWTSASFLFLSVACLSLPLHLCGGSLLSFQVTALATGRSALAVSELQFRILGRVSDQPSLRQ